MGKRGSFVTDIALGKGEKSINCRCVGIRRYFKERRKERKGEREGVGGKKEGGGARQTDKGEQQDGRATGRPGRRFVMTPKLTLASTTCIRDGESRDILALASIGVSVSRKRSVKRPRICRASVHVRRRSRSSYSVFVPVREELWLTPGDINER